MPSDNPDDETDGDNFSSDGYSDYHFLDDSDSISDPEFQDAWEFDQEDQDHDTGFHCQTSKDDLNAASASKSQFNMSIIFDTCRRHLPICPEYRSLGGPSAVCVHCSAAMWDWERVNKGRTGAPVFSMCCGKGQIQLPKAEPTHPYLFDLHQNKEKSPKFRRAIRAYNAMLNFSSIGGKIDRSINKGRGPNIFRMTEINHRKMGSLLPSEGEAPKFCQLYIYDTENEIKNRMKAINVQESEVIQPEIIQGLIKMLEEYNPLVQKFRMARDRFKNENIVDLKIVMKVSRATSGHENHVMPSNEVVALIIGQDDPKCEDRDIIVSSKMEGLKRITSLHPLMMSLQYPLLFPRGGDGFHKQLYYKKIPGGSKKKRENVTQREYYSHTLMVRPGEGVT